MTATTPTDPNRLLWERRAAGDDSIPWESLGTEPAGVQESADEHGHWLRPTTVDRDGALLAIHGGGFVSGSFATHRRLFGHLAVATAAPAYVVDYGLVPEHVYPSQLDLVTDAFARLAATGPVAVVGDSVGATLALGLALRARDQGLPAPAGLLLMSACTDLTASGTSYDAGTDPLFTREFVRGLATGYLAGAAPDAPYASPLQADIADLAGLPPTYFQVGGDEALLDDTRAMAQRMRAAGLHPRVDEFPHQLHTFQMCVGETAVADDAIGKAAAWLRSILET